MYNEDVTIWNGLELIQTATEIVFVLPLCLHMSEEVWRIGGGGGASAV